MNQTENSTHPDVRLIKFTDFFSIIDFPGESANTDPFARLRIVKGQIDVWVLVEFFMLLRVIIREEPKVRGNFGIRLENEWWWEGG